MVSSTRSQDEVLSIRDHILYLGDKAYPEAYTVYNEMQLGSINHRHANARWMLEDQWMISILWGHGSYSTNHSALFNGDDFDETPSVVELLVYNESIDASYMYNTNRLMAGLHVNGYLRVDELNAFLSRESLEADLRSASSFFQQEERLAIAIDTEDDGDFQEDLPDQDF